MKLNIIVGFPTESPAEVRQTLTFLVRMALAGVHDVSLSLFSPYPGSELYADLHRAGRLPELSDEYFLALGAYKDFSQLMSYAEQIGPRTLTMYRLLGYLLFYGTQYATRPWRLIRVAVNLARRRQESRLDKSLQDFADRIRNRQRPAPVRAAG